MFGRVGVAWMKVEVKQGDSQAIVGFRCGLVQLRWIPEPQGRRLGWTLQLAGSESCLIGGSVILWAKGQWFGERRMARGSCGATDTAKGWC